MPLVAPENPYCRDERGALENPDGCEWRSTAGWFAEKSRFSAVKPSKDRSLDFFPILVTGMETEG